MTVLLIVLGLFFVFMLGRSALQMVLCGEQEMPSPFVFLAFGLGVAMVAQVNFVVSVLLHRLDPFFVNTILLGFLLITFFVVLRKKCWIPVHSSAAKMGCVALLSAGPFMFFQMINNLCFPYGQWDAWSFWNFRANALFRGAEQWSATLHNTVQAKHPWLLSSFVAWGWGILGREEQVVPIMLSFLMTVSLLGLFMAILWSDFGGVRAVLGTVFLASIPCFTYHASSQYADIVLSFYILGMYFSLSRVSMGDRRPGYIFLAIVLFGCAVFTKDEGWLYGGLLFFVFRRVFGLVSNWTSILIYAGIALLPTIFYKMTLTDIFIKAPHITSNIGENSFRIGYLMQIDRWKELASFSSAWLLSPEDWGLDWGLFYVSLAFSFLGRKDSQSQRCLGEFLVGAFSVLWVLYLVTESPLLWKFMTTAAREIFILLPFIILYVFHLVFARRDGVFVGVKKRE